MAFTRLPPHLISRQTAITSKLFVPPDIKLNRMWMKNTQIPLTAAFLDGDGTIVNIADKRPGSTEYYCASRPVRHVLEMNRGWFLERGIGTGARVTGLKKAPEGR
jgi:uncharacterized protein